MSTSARRVCLQKRRSAKTPALYLVVHLAHPLCKLLAGLEPRRVAHHVLRGCDKAESVLVQSLLDGCGV